MRLVIGLVALFLAQPAFAQDERPTGYPRSANEANTKPVSVSVVYTADIRSNVDGGIARGTRYLDNLDVQVALDADRLIGDVQYVVNPGGDSRLRNAVVVGARIKIGR